MQITSNIRTPSNRQFCVYFTFIFTQNSHLYLLMIFMLQACSTPRSFLSNQYLQSPVIFDLQVDLLCLIYIQIFSTIQFPPLIAQYRNWLSCFQKQFSSKNVTMVYHKTLYYFIVRKFCRQKISRFRDTYRKLRNFFLAKSWSLS